MNISCPKGQKKSQKKKYLAWISQFILDKQILDFDTQEK